MSDPVNHPKHYTDHPSGIECIQITEHMSFNLGNALKYIWRCDLKADAIEDLKKAKWYLEREIAKREAEAAPFEPAPLEDRLPEGWTFELDLDRVANDGDWVATVRDSYGCIRYKSYGETKARAYEDFLSGYCGPRE